MKKSAFTLFFALLFFYCNNGTAYTKPFRQKQALQPNPALTSEDRKNFIVTIAKEDIGKPMSASADPDFPTNVVYVSCKLKVTNNSNDTLKYLTKSCTWANIIKTSNSKLRIWKNGCSNDFTKVEFVPPHKYTWFIFSVGYNKTKVAAHTPFKIGLGIFKLVDKHQLLTFDPSKNFTETDTNNLIWSNAVAIPR